METTGGAQSLSLLGLVILSSSFPLITEMVRRESVRREKEKGKEEREREEHLKASPPPPPTRVPALIPGPGPCTPHHGATAAAACRSHPHGSDAGPGDHSPQAVEKNPLCLGRGWGGDIRLVLWGTLGDSKELGWVDRSTAATSNQPPSLENLTGRPLPAQHLKTCCS